VGVPPEGVKVKISIDEEARALIVEDSGIGMLKEDLLGSTMQSGLRDSPEVDMEVRRRVGLAGFGFFSVFLVADKVEVFSKSMKVPENEQAWKYVYESCGNSLSNPGDIEFLGKQNGTRLSRFQGR
jgi:HSP90 family molecular chaperone